MSLSHDKAQICLSVWTRWCKHAVLRYYHKSGFPVPIINQFFLLRDRLTEDDTICSAWIKIPAVSVLGENGWSIMRALYWS